MLVETPHWTAEDESNYEFLKQKYKEREALAEDWVSKRKNAEKSRHTSEGKANPHYPRLHMEAEQARLMFENALLICRLDIMEQQIDIMAGLFQRVGILEGAYQSLALATQTVKVDYANRLKDWLSENRPRKDPAPVRPRAVGEILAEEYKPELRKEQDDDTTTGQES